MFSDITLMGNISRTNGTIRVEGKMILMTGATVAGQLLLRMRMRMTILKAFSFSTVLHIFVLLLFLNKVHLNGWLHIFLFNYLSLVWHIELIYYISPITVRIIHWIMGLHLQIRNALIIELASIDSITEGYIYVCACVIFGWFVFTRVCAFYVEYVFDCVCLLVCFYWFVHMQKRI